MSGCCVRQGANCDPLGESNVLVGCFGGRKASEGRGLWGGWREGLEGYLVGDLLGVPIF